MARKHKRIVCRHRGNAHSAFMVPLGACPTFTRSQRARMQNKLKQVKSHNAYRQMRSTCHTGRQCAGAGRGCPGHGHLGSGCFGARHIRAVRHDSGRALLKLRGHLHLGSGAHHSQAFLDLKGAPHVRSSVCWRLGPHNLLVCRHPYRARPSRCQNEHDSYLDHVEPAQEGELLQLLLRRVPVVVYCPEPFPSRRGRQLPIPTDTGADTDTGYKAVTQCTKQQI